MNRLAKKCLVASTGLHGFLVLLMVFGSAFFVAKEKPLSYPKLQFVPSRFVESALAGGGGNPNLPRTEDRQKGDTLLPQPAPAPPPLQPVKPHPPQPLPPAPKPEVKKTESKKPDLPAPTPKATEVAKRKIDLSELKPITRTETDKAKAEAEAKAREAARQQTAANAARQRLAQQIGKATDAMQRGFSSGTKVDVGGPGGEAYANYATFVQAAYEDAWKILPDLSDDDAVAWIRVTIARNGRITDSRIIRRSGNSTMDKSVQRALDKVKNEGLPPFPDFIKEAERSFTIEFNLKAKRLLG
jgi:TonB family protein